MFDVGLSELLLLAIVALVVLGPEKLPHAARMAGAWIGRIRRTLISVQADIENEVAAAEMRERIRKEMEKAKVETERLLQDAADLKPAEPPTTLPGHTETPGPATPAAHDDSPKP